MALARMANEEQIRFVRLTQIEQERLKLTTAQGKRMVPIFLDLLNDVGDLDATLDYAQQNVGLDPNGQPLPPMIGEVIIAQMRECLDVAKGKILAEVKAQKLADSFGAIGWKAVKEYEAPDIADGEEDAKLIRAAFARAKKSRGNGAQNRGRGGGFGRYARRRPPVGAVGVGGAFAQVQPPPPGVAPVVLPQPAAQYMPANPGFRGRGGGLGRGAQRACFRCGAPDHMQNNCPFGG